LITVNRFFQCFVLLTIILLEGYQSSANEV
jgi:hypothetical protein